MTANIFTTLYEQAIPFCLIDCRERRDYVNGHWFGSTNIPLSILPTRLHFLCPDWNFPIHFLDWGDATSIAAMRYIEKLGYQNIISHETTQPTEPVVGFVQGEYVWSKAFGEVVAHHSDILEVTPQEYMTDYQHAQLVDVRPASEYNRFTLPSSINLPNSLLLANMERLSNHADMVLLHCAGRTRSIIGAHTIKAAGYSGNFGILRGGTQAWELDGFAREHGASRTMAENTESTEFVANFLNRCHILSTHIQPTEIAAFVETNGDHLIFDVSDDAADGVLVAPNIIKISGTNLVQQTDRSIARYHLPILLFDCTSGSRAAFAAYWLSRMGFCVKIAIVNADHLQFSSQKNNDVQEKSDQQLIEKWVSDGTQLYDFRLSSEFASGHIESSRWQNISFMLDQKPETHTIGIIAPCRKTGNMIFAILTDNGWKVDGIYIWQDQPLDPIILASTAAKFNQNETPIDKSALFAGRHFGVLKDAQDYLAWEEDLPDVTPPMILKIWHEQLSENSGE
jgi:rhodanese-related sulfurtransferase